MSEKKKKRNRKHRKKNNSETSDCNEVACEVNIDAATCEVEINEENEESESTDFKVQVIDEITSSDVQINSTCELTSLSKEQKKLLKKQKRAERRKNKEGKDTQDESIEAAEGGEEEAENATLPQCGNSEKDNSQAEKDGDSKERLTEDTIEVTEVACTKSPLVNGLPQELLKLSIAELAMCPFGKWCIQKTGKVVGVLERNHSRVCGGLLSFDSGLRSYVKLSPIDSRLPRILIPYSECPTDVISRPSLYTATLFLAEITDWPSDSQMPFGKIVTQVGRMGDIEAETKMILTENDVIEDPFPEEVEEQLSQLLTNFTIDEKERSYRRDFTDECVFTIDPLTARDLDDALSIALVTQDDPSLPQLYDVGVHIADVSFFIPENSLLDVEAQRRSTSFYLVQKVIHMLPRILSEKACSLTPGEVKLTFSVVWRMDATGKIYDTWFGRSLIRSSVKLAYEHALQMIQYPNIVNEENDLPQIHDEKWTMKDICSKVNQLHSIASNLRKQRFAKGALEISKTKYSFALDQTTGLPAGFTAQITTPAHSLVEEFMLLANISVAKQIYNSYPQLAMLRCHPPPDSKLLRDLNSFCSNFGIKIDSSTSLSLQKSLTPMKKNSDTIYKVVSQFLLRAMNPASYFCSGQVTDPEKFHHFALNESFYTHFTSPIRRYPDIVVHRLLAASLGYTDVTSNNSSKISQIANHCNKRKLASRLVSESSQKFFLLLFIKSAPLIETAVVTNVLDRSFDAIITSLDLKCRVYMDQLTGHSKFRFNSKNVKKTLTVCWPGEPGQEEIKQVISITSEVRLLVSVTDELPFKVKVGHYSILLTFN